VTRDVKPNTSQSNNQQQPRQAKQIVRPPSQTRVGAVKPQKKEDIVHNKSSLMNSDIQDELELTNDITFDKNIKQEFENRAAKTI